MALAVLLGAAAASAQIQPPVNPALIVPLPAGPPPPKITVPVVPKLDTVPAPKNISPPRASFGRRITDCLQDGNAATLGPGDREFYARNCANR